MVGAIALVSMCAAAIGLALVAILLDSEPPAWLVMAVVAGLVTSITVGVFLPRSGVFARPIVRGPSTRPLIALTFDDGPDPEHTPRLLDLLESHGHRATFFVIGARAAAHRDLIREIVRRGHGLGNHSYHHSYLTPLRSAERLRVELDETSAELERTTDLRPRWFRPPVGLLSPPVAEAARRAGLELVAWSASGHDGVARTEVDAAVRRLERSLGPGAIFVLHDGVERGAARVPIAYEVVKRLLPAITSRGLRSVPLDELLAKARTSGDT